MRVVSFLLLPALAALPVAGCGGVFSSAVFSSKEQSRCERALKVLIDTSRDREKWVVDDKAQAPRAIDGQRVTDVTLTYIQNNTRKLVSCYYKPGTTVAVGYTFEGQRLTDADTAAVNRRL